VDVTDLVRTSDVEKRLKQCGSATETRRMRGWAREMPGFMVYGRFPAMQH
jgi:hypothetical protein